MFRKLIERIRFARFSVVHRSSLAAQTKWQSKKFKRLMRFSYENVPMWQRFMDKAKLKPESICLEEIQRLPVTSKRTYIGKSVDDYTDNSKRLSPHWYKTSGSSGVPFAFLLGDQILDPKYVDFASLRFLWWRGIPPSRFPLAKIVRIRLRPRHAPHSFFVSVEDYLRDPIDVLRKIRDFRPLIVATYPSILLDIARIVEKDTSVKWEPPPFLMSLGETLLPTVRARIKHALKSEIYDHYGLEEIGAVGVECERHDGFHINTESVYAEIVDEKGVHVPEGQEGRVVLTDFFNFNMPFIRYDSEDRGLMSYEECGCGLNSPRLWVSGRYSEVLTFSDKRIHHLEFDGAMDGFMNEVVQYQIVKTAQRELVVRIVAGPSYGPHVDKRIVENIRSLAGSDTKVTISLVESIVLSEKGKCQIVLDES